MTRKAQYNQNGYLLLKNFFDKSEIAQIYREARSIFAAQIKRVLGEEVDIDDRNAFEQAMFRLFEKDFTVIINAGKQIQHLISLYRLSTDPKIIHLLQDLGLSFPTVAVKPSMQFNSRFLAKKEEYWKLGAHQDWRTGQGSLDSTVLWFPLVDCGEELGALQVIPGSHLWGLKAADTTGYSGSIQEEIAENQYIQTEFEVGDLLVFSAFLVHRSGNNRSQQVRWSVQYRYNNITEPTFIERGVPMPYLYKPEEQLITPNFPQVEVLEKLFA